MTIETDYPRKWATSNTLDDQRKRARTTKKRITFDCQNARYSDSKVRCSKYATLSSKGKDGLSPLLPVLKGILYQRCEKCQNFKSMND